MHPPQQEPDSEEQNLAEERRLQVGTALLLGFFVLIVIVLRAGIHTVFPAGWWRAW